jgi:anaerobic magnesium-protoporphyrin IX monomethyl ester cyclase
MKVVFIYFDFMTGAGGKYYEGIASISATIKAAGHQSALIHITTRPDADEIVERFGRDYADADIAAFSATSNIFGHVARVSARLKERFPRLVTICGGPHPTLCPEESIAEPGLDAICIGEGEYPLRDLCDGLQAGKDVLAVPGLWIKRNGQILSSQPRPWIRNLDELPMPDRELFDFPHSIDREMGRMAVMGSRGCPFNCTHCCNHAFKALCTDGTPYVRFKSVDRIILEIRTFMSQYPDIGEIHFLDDILTLKPSWFREFATQYKEQVGLPYTCNSRFDLLDEELMELLRDSGCAWLLLGLESGDEEVRRRILKRDQSEERILRLTELGRGKGIQFSLYNMVGIPGETLARARNTVKLNARLRPGARQLSIYYPYVKTELYELCKERGYLTGKSLDSYFEEETTLRLPEFPREQILFAYRNFHDFVAYYETAFRFHGWKGRFLEKLVDFLWLHPRVYAAANPAYRTLKKAYKRIRGRGQNKSVGISTDNGS